jgi:hypothetical protein
LPSSAECGEGLEPAHSLIPCNVLIKVHLKRQSPKDLKDCVTGNVCYIVTQAHKLR